ncbi:uncharacterized protein Bfra_002064 [Botrytis fragariae]|uniref:Uncharacterized protein n=1 Tax=Botrytis fragariae TaxID=1964551 RepID=A0A8H6EME7_9HELO|nr:uncharacterized protein Bfra_002064 [Botrytis fragariae]KAF5877696.1 hypothetical protein Bfra_002064 [Botrytis fragariae]
MWRYMNRVQQSFKWYGPSAIPLFIFGSRTTWCMQAKVLGFCCCSNSHDWAITGAFKSEKLSNKGLFCPELDICHPSCVYCQLSAA